MATVSLVVADWCVARLPSHVETPWGSRLAGGITREKGIAGLLAGLLGLSLGLQGCAAAGRGSEGPIISPTGVVYAPGTPPRETRFSQTAALYLRTQKPDRALELALEGIESDPQNPIHYFLAGVAFARVGEYQRADQMFVEAQERYPAYELDIEPEREAAWAEAFNRGTEAYASGETEEAIQWWRRAVLIYDLRLEAHRNLAMLLAGEGRYEEAIEVHEQALAGLGKRPATRVLGEAALQRRAEATRTEEEKLAELLLITDRFREAEPLFRRQLRRDPTNRTVQRNLAQTLAGQGRDTAAAEIYDALLAEEDLSATELLDIGVGLFRSRDFTRAAVAFGRVTELRPQSRDAWFNHANALFAAKAWEPLVAVADRLIELDPLGDQARLIWARARLETGDESAALQGLNRIREAPVHVQGLVMRHSGGRTSVHGRLAGNQPEPGEPVLLRFLFYRDSEELGRETVTLSAPPSGESQAFEVSFAAPATAYRYEVVAARR